MLDGYLCGVLLQPQPIPEGRWMVHVTDAEGHALPAAFDASALHALVRRRYAQLDDLIARRHWFDPWVFELDDAQDASPDDKADPDAPATIDAVLPWVAGFATAQEFFPGLMQFDAARLTAPLALIYRHLEADDLEDADDLLEEIESLEPPVDLSEAVEGLVRATLLLADLSRPVQAPRGPTAKGPVRRR